MLYNEKYAGVWRFNERRWVKDLNRISPITGKPIRIAQMKDPSEVEVQLHPERRIPSEELWDAVHERLRRVHALHTRNADGTKKGRAAAGQATKYPLSSLLVCGEKNADGTYCGAPMSIQGNGRYYKCGDHARGVCMNGKPVREELMRRRLLEALHDRLASSEGIDHLRKRYAAWAGERERSRGAETVAVRERIARLEKRIANLVEAMADGQKSEALTNALSDQEHQLQAERRTLAALAHKNAEPVRLPSRDEVLARVLEFGERVKADPVKAREFLRRLLAGGRIWMEPQADDSYIARCEFYPLILVLETAQPPQAGRPEGAENYSGSGGRI